ncbi:GDP-mannose 4,6-dehydratase [Pseudarthrobacter sp. BIM B-2242]|uniref:GDP-mannose 4,6-dehydratase n=1 Tax=Pseudarthrobacter sp. BIM B-2242 TaxID=2772401 RepID=UPI001CC5C4A9|nr:GDP-mannose 4,6-dehydratase [Pseudarthrobacter sp. BIM B-2242]
MSPRALITGSTGQDGSYLQEMLLADGYDIHVFVRRHDTEAEALDSGVTTHFGDLADDESIRKAVDASEPDVIFNLGGISSVAASWGAPTRTAVVTGAATAELLEGAWRLQERLGRPVKFVQASSAEIFGISRDNPQTETSVVRPVNPYGAAKAYAHHMVAMYRNRGLHSSAAILFNHESPRRPEQFVTRKITLGVAKIAAGLQDTLRLGNLDVRRDWGWAPDYVDAMIRMSSTEAADDYVVATGESHSLREFVQAAFESAGIHDWERYVLLDPTLARPADAPEMRGDPAKAALTLGWRPTVPFFEIASRMVQNDLKIVT